MLFKLRLLFIIIITKYDASIEYDTPNIRLNLLKVGEIPTM